MPSLKSLTNQCYKVLQVLEEDNSAREAESAKRVDVKVFCQAASSLHDPQPGHCLTMPEPAITIPAALPGVQREEPTPVSAKIELPLMPSVCIPEEMGNMLSSRLVQREGQHAEEADDRKGEVVDGSRR